MLITKKKHQFCERRSKARKQLKLKVRENVKTHTKVEGEK